MLKVQNLRGVICSGAREKVWSCWRGLWLVFGARVGVCVGGDVVILLWVWGFLDVLKSPPDLIVLGSYVQVCLPSN